MTAPSPLSGPAAGGTVGTVVGRPRLKPTIREVLAATERPLVGLWSSSGSPVAAEILAASGADLLVVDGEHGPVELRDILAILQASEAYPITPVVRVPWNDPVRIKQVLDLGAQSIIVPMVSSADEARAAVAAARYPGAEGERLGRRGIGSALARSARWGLVPGYVRGADAHVSVIVQIETADGVANAAEIAAVDGVDAVFIGPADLAGSLGHPGAPAEPEVVAAVDATIEAVAAQGVPVGVNAFAPADADRVIARGAAFVVVSSDVTLMATGARAAVDRLRPAADSGTTVDHTPDSAAVDSATPADPEPDTTSPASASPASTVSASTVGQAPAPDQY